MRRPLLTLTLLTGTAAALAPRADATSVPVDVRAFPPDRLIVRDCYDTPHAEPALQMKSSGARSGYGYGGGGASGGVVGGVHGGALGGVAQSAPTPSAPPPASAPRPRAADEAKRESAARQNSVADSLQEEAEAPFGFDAGGAPLPERDAAQTRTVRPSGPAMEWGGTIHLSNDDSASLASAQRLLWALERGASIALGQIRPHELLNWFGFDTTPPSEGETFAVQASAEQIDGDTLALALAVKGATPARPPMDLTILVDRSGSMSGEGRMTYVKRALDQAASSLRPGDRVDLVLFDDRVCTPVENLVVGRDDLGALRRELDRMQPRGSTDLNLGLQEAYRLATAHAATPGRARRVLTLTDAILNTGEVRPDVVTEVARGLDQHGIRMTGVGVGTDFRDDVLDQLTEKGKGAYVFLGDERAVDRIFGRGFEALVHTIAEDVRFALELPASLGMERFYGEEASRDPKEVQPVNFQSGNHQVFFQDLAIRDGWLRPTDALTLSVSWTDPVTGRRTGQSFGWTVAQAMAGDTHNVRKARALHAFTDVLTARAMGGATCGPEVDTWIALRDRVPGDAELAYVDGLLGRSCDTHRPVVYSPPPPRPSTTTPTKIKLDSDVAISEVDLSCPGGTQQAALASGNTVATFRTLPGSCQVVLHGQVPLVAWVDVPATGKDLRCVVRGGRVQCL